MKVNIEDVVEAIEYVSDSQPSFYVIPEEKVITVNEREVDRLPYEEYDLIRLPDRKDVDDYGNMRRFIERVKDETAKEWLANAIVGRGAFRMFRATLERFHMLNDWYDYRDRCHRVLAMDWCEENGIEYEGPRYTIEEDEEDDLYDDFDDEYEETPEPVRAPAPAKQEAPQFRLVEIGRKNVSQLIFLASDNKDEQLVKTGKQPAKNPDEAGEELEALMAKGERVTAVSDHGRFLGYCMVKPREDGTAVMHEIFVRKDMRRKGIGTMLVSAACSDADENHERLVFHVRPDHNEMLSLLEKQGFVTVSWMEIGHRDEAETEEKIQVGSHSFRL